MKKAAIETMARVNNRAYDRKLSSVLESVNEAKSSKFAGMSASKLRSGLPASDEDVVTGLKHLKEWPFTSTYPFTQFGKPPFGLDGEGEV